MLRRSVDVGAAVLGLVVLSPLLLAVAAAVVLTLGRPVLFRQLRIGRDEVPFTILKFRSMRAEAYPGEPDAERDSAFGRLIRGSSVDELPQLVNVLRGDMSLIGPRPTLPEQVVLYTPRQRGRHAVRPGLTGWAQVNGRNSISWPERIELDLQYIEHRSLGMDLRILGRTVRRLVRPTGIYGAGGVNAGFPGPSETPPVTEPGRGEPRPPAGTAG